ncbi:hypothetical protein A3F06_02695 [candidate division TM6 bacterium RIFCSPHIGHO2_12_FULL_36_22]|nr:MAG: hypothetical protein A3F06_02695 [candidate division TM6 bacterium RIFCSPHIGHO2_12_FULL_36_22]
MKKKLLLIYFLLPTTYLYGMEEQPSNGSNGNNQEEEQNQQNEHFIKARFIAVAAMLGIPLTYALYLYIIKSQMPPEDYHAMIYSNPEFLYQEHPLTPWARAIWQYLIQFYHERTSSKNINRKKDNS